jgi:hypothetical protein
MPDTSVRSLFPYSASRKLFPTQNNHYALHDASSNIIQSSTISILQPLISDFDSHVPQFHFQRHYQIRYIISNIWVDGLDNASTLGDTGPHFDRSKKCVPPFSSPKAPRLPSPKYRHHSPALPFLPSLSLILH